MLSAWNSAPSELMPLPPNQKDYYSYPEVTAPTFSRWRAKGAKFVLTGGPPSIFDAERGQITGDSLTFYKRDDRVVVKGNAKSPTVTQTRVAR